MSAETFGYDQPCECGECRTRREFYASGYAAATETARNHVEMLREIGSEISIEGILSLLDSGAAYLGRATPDTGHRWPSHR